MKKATHTRFPLTTQAGRVALLTGITAGTVPREEVEAAVLVDTKKRPYRKPVVAWGHRFDSVTEAANARIWQYEKFVTIDANTFELVKIPAAEMLAARPRAIDALKHRITRYCNADNVEGFYWSE